MMDLCYCHMQAKQQHLKCMDQEIVADHKKITKSKNEAIRLSKKLKDLEEESLTLQGALQQEQERRREMLVNIWTIKFDTRMVDRGQRMEKIEIKATQPTPVGNTRPLNAS